MKFNRFASLLAIAAAFPALSFAAGSINVGNLSGQARATYSGATIVLKSGTSIQSGTIVETNTGSSLELTFADGVKLVLSPGTRIRIKSFEAASGLFSCEIVLLRGSITGDATTASTASNLTIRTTAGVVSVAGSSFRVAFTPVSAISGSLNVVSLQGDITVLPVNATGLISIPSGSQVNVGASGVGGTVAPANSAVLLSVRTTLTSGEPGVAQPSAPEGQRPVVTGGSPGATVVNPGPDLGVILTISPNGEGSPGL